ncbi:efflux RND transporter permease subunit [Bowmanella sp. JS7-9]|uniref:Efflux RND transporter permease subunit n=1 Tax=Pseudobowmanella zhangzhouensis TaxID=1537679 RepID=A0ABW1XJX4_9ALTE|nr:efflux RND transporter permease subunit [Bowmanella sp. JS7-9]TBX23060.1 acriflavin resistance protein [Bowmanella sp. JS7-9]
MNKLESVSAGLATFALRRPVTIGMLFFSLLLLGIAASRLLPLEKFPAIDVPFIVVVTPYPNATPVEIEKMITKPVEEALATMSGIERMQSFSFEDRSEVMIEFKWDENLKAKSVEAREKIDAIRHLLPDDVQRVMVYKWNTSDEPIVQLRVSSEKDLSNAYDLLDRNLKMQLERVPGVARVELYGVDKRQISIRIDSERMAALHVNPNTLAQTLRNANFSMTAGHFFDNNEKITINPQGEYRSIDEIRELFVAKGIRLQDVADVRLETPERTEGRHLDQTYAVGFNVYRESGSNLVEVADRVMAVIDDAKTNPTFDGINLFVMRNQADNVTQSLSDLLDAGLIGALLSVLVLYAFLRQFRATLIVVLSVPFSVCITLGFMYFFGYSLNILSMMGLLLAVGMLVDNAVVVTESIYHEREGNPNPRSATLAGVSKVSLAMIAGTATTAIVFLPNIVGEKMEITIFLEHVAIAICISLFASLLIAQTLIPLLSTKITFRPKAEQKPSRMLAWYKSAVEWTLFYQYRALFIAILLVAGTIVLQGMVKSDQDGDHGNNRVWLNYNINASYSLEEVEKTVSAVEKYLYDNQEKFFITQVYSWYTPGQAVSGISLQKDLPIPQAELRDMILKDMPKLPRANPSFKWDDSNGGGVRLTLLGTSSDVLMKIADNLVPVLGNIEGLQDVRTDIGEKKYELQLTIDRQKAYRFGLDAQTIGSVVSTALRGSNLRTFRNDERGEVNIRMLFDENLQHSVALLKNLPLTRVGTQNVTLDMVASLTVSPRLSQVNRFYRQTALSIGANLKEDFTLEEARKSIENVMQHIALPDGYSWTLDGSFRRQEQAENVMLTNMLLAVCMIYVVMAALFESILLPTAVITSLVFSFTGVFLAFILTGTNMGVMGMIGMLILMGIVVNNGIVLVDRTNQLIDSGMDVRTAIVQGCLDRVRPVLMTVGTTVLGLVPLAMGGTQIGGDGPPYAPMAIAIIGGLIVSTATSLLLLPLTYLLLLKLRQKTAGVLGSVRRTIRQLPVIGTPQ